MKDGKKTIAEKVVYGAFDLLKAKDMDALDTFLKALDAVVYTGFGFPGRDLMLIRSSDAVVIGCGRIGTIHEFTVAWEANMPLGILEGEWATDEVIRNIIKSSNRENKNVIFEKDPKRMIERLIEMIHKKEESGETEMRL